MNSAHTIMTTLEVIGVLAFALSGLFVARQQRLDTVGTCIAAFLAAFGGGTLRDLLLDVRPFYWVRHSELLWAVLALAVLAPWALRLTTHWLSERLIVVADAVGLGIFSAAGTLSAMHLGWPDLPCMLIGVVTAVCGGLLRDMACHQPSMLMQDRVPYASCAFLGNGVLIGLYRYAGWTEFWTTVLAAALIAGLRILLVLLKARLPSWPGEEGSGR